MSRSQSRVVGLKHLIISWWMLSSPGGLLPFLKRDMESPRSRVVNGVKMVSWLSVFSRPYRLFVAYLAALVRLPVEQELVGNRVRCNVRRADWLSVVSLIFERVCHPFLLLCVRSTPVIVSSHFCFLVSLMWSFRLVPASMVYSLKGSASYSSW